MIPNKDNKSFPVGSSIFGIRDPLVLGPALVESKRVVQAVANAVPKNGKLLEIGTWTGALAAMVSDLRPDVEIVSVDCFDGTYDCLAPCYTINKRHRPNMRLFMGWSHEFWPLCRDQGFDAVLVDADHKEETTFRDLCQAARVLSPRGVMMAHDYRAPGWQGVTVALDRFLAEHQEWKLDAMVDSLAILRQRPNDLRADVSDITVCLIHYKRPESLERCLRSLRDAYPDVPLVSVDTEGNQAAGRNAAIRQATTPYVMLCEDDFQFRHEPYLQALRDVLEHDATIGGAAGSIYQPRDGRHYDWYADMTRFRREIKFSIPAHFVTTANGVRYVPCDLVPNSGVWRREVFDHIPFDEAFHVRGHVEWLWRLKDQEQWRAAFVPSATIDHWQDRDDPEYVNMRFRPEFVELERTRLGAEIPPFDGICYT